MPKKNPAALAHPSDLADSVPGSREALSGLGPRDAAVLNAGLSAGRARVGLPAPMRMRLHGGEDIELAEDQIFADKVVVRAGERGRVLYPSSQAASWVVHFSRVGAKLRVLPECLLREI
jgi:hypothetical protein